MKLPTFIALLTVMISSKEGFSMLGTSVNHELISFSQAEKPDSLTITVFVSFTVKKNGQVGKIEVAKTECSEYDIGELDKKAIRTLEKNAKRVIEEMDNFDPIEETTRFMQPIKMKLPTARFLKKD